MADVERFRRVMVDAHTVGDVRAWLEAADSLDLINDDTELTEPATLDVEFAEDVT